MFALKSHQLGSKKKVGLEKQGVVDEMDDEVIKARFQEIGPRMTIKMRWIRRGGLGETGDERDAREKEEKEQGIDASFGEGAGPQEDADGDAEMGEVGGKGGDATGDGDDEEDERAAAKAIGLDEEDADGQPNFDFNAAAAAAEASNQAGPSEPPAAKPPKGPRTVPRKRKRPYHALLRPPPSPSPPPGFQDSEPIPLPAGNGKGQKEASILSTVGKTWHAGKGEGGVREARKRSEWGWEVSLPTFPPLALCFGQLC